MLNGLISLALKNRFLVLLFTLLLVGFGIRSAIVLPLDAFPDTTPNQVQINAVAPALAPEEVERQIAFPVELALGGLKGLQDVRSSSKFGLCQVVATFSDDTDVYFARQQVTERLEELELPEGIDRPHLGPVATGLGEVYHYLLKSDVHDLMELRTLQDWVIRPRLRRVPGVAEVTAWGGLAKQFEVRHSPDRLAQYGLTLDELLQRSARTTRTKAAATSSEPAVKRWFRALAGHATWRTSKRSWSQRATECRSASGT